MSNVPSLNSTVECSTLGLFRIIKITKHDSLLPNDNVVVKTNTFITFKGNQLLCVIVKVVKLLTKFICRLINLEVTENLVMSFTKIVPEISFSMTILLGLSCRITNSATVYGGLSRPENGRFQVSSKYNLLISPTSNT